MWEKEERTVVDDEPRCLFPSLELIAKPKQSNCFFLGGGFRERERERERARVEMNQFNIVVLVSFQKGVIHCFFSNCNAFVKCCYKFSQFLFFFTNEMKFNNTLYFIVKNNITSVPNYKTFLKILLSLFIKFLCYFQLH